MMINVVKVLVVAVLVVVVVPIMMKRFSSSFLRRIMIKRFVIDFNCY